jgi:RNA polymerase sigma-70 factor (ECF subfamily)
MSDSSNHADSHQWFQPTHWSVVLSAGRRDGEDAAFAREEMCRAYWPPIYAFIRRRGHTPEDAQDLTQEFLLHLLDKNAMDRVDPSKGKFRSYLLVAVKHFLANARDKANAAKRGGGLPSVPLDEVEQYVAADTRAGLSAEVVYDHQWALAIMERALARLHERHMLTGRAQLFAALQGFLSREPDAGEYASLQKSLGMTDKAIAMAVYRLRHQYRELVTDEVNHTVSSSGDADEELHYLLEILSR